MGASRPQAGGGVSQSGPPPAARLGQLRCAANTLLQGPANYAAQPTRCNKLG
ncbi:hypothetical protein [Paenibacillus sp. Soil766]|uniref:hypothetical protein n=1 Tax=Paenibacillus sp. Soil766 TaxID=1736404 RepID=UPI0012F8B9D4|nr:hypothetical protein [Paenibacillus sp. Soil766]